MNVVIDWESRDTHEVAQLPNVYPGDRVRVMGWKGIHTVVKRPWFHKVLQGYITEVETETGRRVKMLVDELSPVHRTTVPRPNQLWYRAYENVDPTSVGIRPIHIKVLARTRRAVTPGKKGAVVTAVARAGTKATCLVRQTRQGLVTEGIAWKSRKAHGAVLCAVRRRLLGLK